MLFIIILHIMGCQTAYPNSVCVRQSNLQTRELIMNLLRNIKINKFFFSDNNYKSILNDFQKNPQKYQLIPPRKLIPYQSVPNLIMEKWKLILFGLDRELENYNKCLSYYSLNHTQINTQNKEKKQENAPKILANAYADKKLIKLREHKNFKQIENDANRTLNLTESQQNILKTVLKRLTNYFPKMGYTQGLNCIAGYLIKIGYSQQDTYWMIVHLALNKRYMLLGLFEDGFPLSRTYAVIFKNVLKRKASQLYKHFYENNHFMQDQLWFFKWFTTYYIYSFPLQMILYVFDFVIQRGGLALISLAAALVKYFQSTLLLIEQQNDISLIYNPLKILQNFNQRICMFDLMKMASQIEVIQQDCSNLNIYSAAPYAQYILYSLKYQKQTMNQYLRFKKLLKKQQACFIPHKCDPTDLQLRMDDILTQWYEKIRTERQLFLQGKSETTNNQSQQLSKFQTKQKQIDQLTTKQTSQLKNSNDNVKEQQPAPFQHKVSSNSNAEKEIRQSKISINIIYQKPYQPHIRDSQNFQQHEIQDNNIFFKENNLVFTQRNSEQQNKSNDLELNQNIQKLQHPQSDMESGININTPKRKKSIVSNHQSNNQSSQWHQNVYIRKKNKSNVKVKTQQQFLQSSKKSKICLDKIDTLSVKNNQQHTKTNIKIITNFNRNLFSKRYNQQHSHTSSYISDANDIKQREEGLHKNQIVMAGKSIVANHASRRQLNTQNDYFSSLTIDYPKTVQMSHLLMQKQKNIKNNAKKQKHNYPHDIFQTSYGIKDQALCQKSKQDINVYNNKNCNAEIQIQLQNEWKNNQTFKKNNKQDPQIRKGKYISYENIPGPFQQGKSQTFIFDIELPNNLEYSSSNQDQSLATKKMFEKNQGDIKSMKQYPNF